MTVRAVCLRHYATILSHFFVTCCARHCFHVGVCLHRATLTKFCVKNHLKKTSLVSESPKARMYPRRLDLFYRSSKANSKPSLAGEKCKTSVIVFLSYRCRFYNECCMCCMHTAQCLCPLSYRRLVLSLIPND